MGRGRGKKQRHNKDKWFSHRHSNFDSYVGRIVVTDMDDIKELADEIWKEKEKTGT